MDDLRLEVGPDLLVVAGYREFAGIWDVPVVESGFDRYEFPEPLNWQVSVSNTGGALLVMGTVEGDAVTTCARCAEPFALHLEGEVEDYFLIGDDSDTEFEEGEEEEFEHLPDDHVIDLEVLLKAALLLEFPLVPLHSEDCLGLCPQCGKNLNEGPCECQAPVEDMPPNPFAVLKDYSFED